MREEAGDREGAENYARQAADHDDTYVLVRLAKLREKAGEREGAENLYQQAADHGDTGALMRLAELREEAGDREGAGNLYRQAADRGTERYDLMRPVLAAWWPNGLDPTARPRRHGNSGGATWPPLTSEETRTGTPATRKRGVRCSPMSSLDCTADVPHVTPQPISAMASV
ncbi:tetratricopeptide repeat protein [Streptomyces sp. NPDC054958]